MIRVNLEYFKFILCEVKYELGSRENSSFVFKTGSWLWFRSWTPYCQICINIDIKCWLQLHWCSRIGSILIKYSEKDKERFSILSSPDWLLGEVKTNRTIQDSMTMTQRQTDTRGFKAKSHITKLFINVLMLIVLGTWCYSENWSDLSC